MTFEEKLLSAFKSAEEQTSKRSAKQKMIVLQSVQVLENNKNKFPLRLDQFRHPKTIVIAENTAKRYLKQGFKLAVKPSGVPSGVATVSDGEEPKKPATKGRPRKQAPKAQ